MTSPRQAMPFRLAHSSMQLALRLWPEETRDWGHALAAELYEIERPFEALWWAIGGLMLFSRASASHFLAWLKLPAGARLSAGSSPLETETPILPKRSRLFTAAVLVATAAIFFLPHSREAVSTVRATWQGYYHPLLDSDRRTLEQLAARAERENDTRTLAFVALTMPRPGDGMRLADKAVSLDPSFTWIYASRFYRPEDVPQPPEWLARLHASDPDNAFVYLANADAMVQPRYRAMLAHRTPAPQEIESALANDPQWLAQMESAFRAPRYNNYLRKHWELIRYEWDRDPALSPAIIGYGLWSHRIPDLRNLQIFAKIEIQHAHQALSGGHPDQAASILQEVDGFGSRMSEQAESNFERLVALDLSRQAREELRDLYSATGRAREASDASARLQEIENRRRTFVSLPYLAQSDSLRQEAMLFQSFAILLCVCGVIMALSFLLLELRPRSFPQRRAAWQRILCRTADYAPASFLILSFAFLMSFLPIAQLFAHYRSASASIDTFREISGTLWGLMEVPSSVQNTLDPPFFWWFLTTVLVVLAALLLFRLFTRNRTMPQPTP
jgi:hypothetical protein